MKTISQLLRKITCFFAGHPCVPTGRHAILLKEWRCQRCKGVYIAHADFGQSLLPANEGSDRILIDYMAAIEAADALPHRHPR